MTDFAIQAEGLGKRYRIARRSDRYGRLTESMSSAIRAPLARLRGERPETREWVWALRDVTFELQHGDIVGVIGRNGAGKTTLLKVLSRITEPSAGKAILRGRVGSLLEVGTGFHPELTGRENVFMSGAVLGMSRADIKRRFDEIVAFAEVERFLDTPVKRYSSGMQVRLGFAVAAHLEPDILFVDEVLAVGDIAFQEKCLGKLNDVATSGRTVIFVSHNMSAIGTLCPVSLWLDGGRVIESGATHDVVSDYVRASAQQFEGGEYVLRADEKRDAQVTRVRILSPRGELAPVSECSDPIAIELTINIRRRLRGLYGYLEIRLPSGMTVMMSDSLDTTPNPLDDLPVGQHVVTVVVPARSLAPGAYEVLVSLASPSGHTVTVDSPGVVAAFQLHDFTSDRGEARPGFFSTMLAWSATQDAA